MPRKPQPAPIKRNPPRLLPAKIQYAIEFYLDTRDIGKAALAANMDPAEFAKAMETDQVKAEIDRKLDFIDQAAAELRAKARILTADKLDATLVDVLNTKSKNLSPKVKALELGYKRHGLLKEKVEHSGENGGPVTFQLVRIGSRSDANG